MVLEKHLGLGDFPALNNSQFLLYILGCILNQSDTPLAIEGITILNI